MSKLVTSVQLQLKDAIKKSPVKTCVLMALMTILVVDVIFTYWAWGNWVVSVQSNQVEKFVEQHAKKIRANIGTYLFSVNKKLEFFTQSSEMEIALTDENTSELALFETKIAERFEEVDTVRIFAAGKAKVDLDTTPPLRFSDVDMIKQAEARQSVPPEAVKYASDWRINVIVPVPSDESKPVAGVVLVTLKLDILAQKINEGVESFGGVVLWQRFGVSGQHQLLAKGSGWDQERIEMDIPDTLWNIGFSSGDALKQRTKADFPMMPIYGMTVGLVLLLSISGACFLGFIVGRVIETRRETAYRQLSESAAASPGKMVNNNTLDIGSFECAEGDDSLLGFEELGEELGEELESDGEMLEEEPTVESAFEDDDRYPAHVFRSYDIRGLADSEIDNVFCQKLGQALGSQALNIGENDLVVARDSRTHSPIFTEYLIRGILSSGCNVINIGTVPTPLLYYATETLDETRSGVVVTASHSPGEWNGFKIVMAGKPCQADELLALRQRMMREQFTNGIAQEGSKDLSATYIDAIFSDVALAGDISIVVDAGHGATGKIAPQLFEELGCDVTMINCDLDGAFPSHGPDPGKAENLKGLVEKVKETGADLGVAFDGDGDRLTVVSSSGQIIWPERLLMLFASDILARNPGADVVYDVKCSRQVASVISQSGGRPIMWKSGHATMKSKMRETGALLGGEFSGHIFVKDRWFGFDDGMYAAARLIEIMSLRDESLDDIFTDYQEIPNTRDVRVKVDEGKKFALIEQLVDTGDFGEAKITTLDGLRADFPFGWGLVRASNTAAELTLRMEANTDAELHELKSLFTRELRKIDNKILINWKE